MKRIAILLFNAMLAGGAAGAEHYVQTAIGACTTWACSEPQTATAWDSGAWVESRLLGRPYVIGMRNSHDVFEDNVRRVGWRSFDGYASDWHSYQLGGAAVGHCYNAHLTSVAGSSEKDIPSSPWRVCWSGAGGGCGCDLNDEGPGSDCPLILNLGRGPWRLTGADDPVAFDLDADGELDRIGWTARGTSLAFLAADLDQDGRIADGRELFGVGTELPDGSRAPNGFAALRQHDSNSDGVIDARDPVWTSLLLWTDRNHDGQSQTSEITAVTQSGVTSLELDARTVGKRDVHGNTFRLKSHYRMGATRQPYYDVFFAGAE